MRSRETNIPVQANKRGKLLPVSTAVILMIAFGASFLGFSQTAFVEGQGNGRGHLVHGLSRVGGEVPMATSEHTRPQSTGKQTCTALPVGGQSDAWTPRLPSSLATR